MRQFSGRCHTKEKEKWSQVGKIYLPVEIFRVQEDLEKFFPGCWIAFSFWKKMT